MIPGKIIRFLEDRASIGFAGTRDSNLVPRGHRVSGWLVDAGGRTATALIPATTANELIEALLDNGRIALTFEEVGTHETYQLKGRYISHRPADPSEVEIANRLRERFVRGLRALYPHQGLADWAGASIPAPSLSVKVEVQEVFLQTPGPGAGARIAPPPGVDASTT